MKCFQVFVENAPLRQYIPLKPSKYGMKIYALVYAETYHLYNLEVYAGK